MQKVTLRIEIGIMRQFSRCEFVSLAKSEGKRFRPPCHHRPLSQRLLSDKYLCGFEVSKCKLVLESLCNNHAITILLVLLLSYQSLANFFLGFIAAGHSNRTKSSRPKT